MKNQKTERRPIPETGVCCLCGGAFRLYGNNPYPLCDASDYDSRCCHKCDKEKVWAAREILDRVISSMDALSLSEQERAFLLAAARRGHAEAGKAVEE